ncbi:MAG: PH domain-containing protein, partial [Acidobacteriota bacterium]
PARAEVLEQTRPSKQLLTYYVLVSLFLGPFFFFILIPMAIRYATLRYSFDEEGVSMSWGRLFRREVHLSYHQIQDIHLVSNLLERRLGLARIQVQTASGSSDAEMTIEGIRDYAILRDHLYDRMLYARGEAGGGRSGGASPRAPAAPGGEELTLALREVAAELRGLRRDLEAGDIPSKPRA